MYFVNFTVTNSMTYIASLNIKYTIENKELLPRRLDELNDSEVDSLATAVFRFLLPDKVPVSLSDKSV